MRDWVLTWGQAKPALGLRTAIAVARTIGRGLGCRPRWRIQAPIRPLSLPNRDPKKHGLADDPRDPKPRDRATTGMMIPKES